MYNNFSSKSLENILVDLKLVSQDDLMSAIILAKAENLPLEAVLIENKNITLEQLKSALKQKYGLDTVTQEQIASINPDVLSIFPEDFVKLYNVIPISKQGNKLVVAMVKPDDKSAVNNIIGFTGVRPEILIITYPEFQELVKKYYN